MALVAADDAAREAGLAAGSFDGERLGIFWGSGMAGASTFETTCRTGLRRSPPHAADSVVTTMPNAPVAELALALRRARRRPRLRLRLRVVGGRDRQAMRAIRAGWIDVAIAGGSESLLTPGVLASWQAMRVLAPLAAGADRPTQRAARMPAVRRRPRRLRARRGRRGVRPRIARACTRARRDAALRQLAGYATNCDGVHITQPDAAGQARAMRAALADAGLAAGAIGHLNAHGTATLAGDAAEAESIASRVRRATACR